MMEVWIQCVILILLLIGGCAICLVAVAHFNRFPPLRMGVLVLYGTAIVLSIVRFSIKLFKVQIATFYFTVTFNLVGQAIAITGLVDCWQFIYNYYHLVSSDVSTPIFLRRWFWLSVLGILPFPIFVSKTLPLIYYRIVSLVLVLLEKIAYILVVWILPRKNPSFAVARLYYGMSVICRAGIAAGIFLRIFDVAQLYVYMTHFSSVVLVIFSLMMYTKQFKRIFKCLFLRNYAPSQVDTRVVAKRFYQSSMRGNQSSVYGGRVSRIRNYNESVSKARRISNPRIGCVPMSTSITPRSNNTPMSVNRRNQKLQDKEYWVSTGLRSTSARIHKNRTPTICENEKFPGSHPLSKEKSDSEISKSIHSLKQQAYSPKIDASPPAVTTLNRSRITDMKSTPLKLAVSDEYCRKMSRTSENSSQNQENPIKSVCGEIRSLSIQDHDKNSGHPSHERVLSLASYENEIKSPNNRKLRSHRSSDPTFLFQRRNNEISRLSVCQSRPRHIESSRSSAGASVPSTRTNSAETGN
ncbi:hypothetical protein AAMO2058_001222800 [Amorphochlora amoebiformis]|uniref:Uncharacterized protein n=1 Tax=Amorphochlora amoebiformis TaxID=1561963 RepID=A0A7S0H6U3_9EUKA|mmetsp:Transcript_7468/g.11550  ORF Transcript_7468/g.11550 Transcript_7468/m.11550 type:complete len:524 (+) Transcript_7468:353-1924(+)